LGLMSDLAIKGFRNQGRESPSYCVGVVGSIVLLGFFTGKCGEYTKVLSSMLRRLRAGFHPIMWSVKPAITLASSSDAGSRPLAAVLMKMGQKGAKRARTPKYVTDNENTNLGCAHSATLLEAFPAENRPPLGGTEGHSCFFPTLRAICLGFRAHRRAAAEVPFGTLRFTRFAPFGLIFEPFIGEKHLLARSEYKFGATLRTLQDLVVIFHEPLSPSPGQGRGM